MPNRAQIEEKCAEVKTALLAVETEMDALEQAFGADECEPARLKLNALHNRLSESLGLVEDLFGPMAMLRSGGEDKPPKKEA